MPNPHAVVATTIQIERPTGEERAGDAVVSLGDRRIRLAASDSRSAGFTEVLEGLARLNHPVYAEIDPDTDTITRLLLPKVGRVLSVDESEGELAVSMDTSHALLRIPAGDDATELAATLRQARDDRRVVIVTADDSGQIIDARELPPGTEGALPPFVPVGPVERRPGLVPRRPWLRVWPWLWTVIRWPWCWWFCCISASRAQQVFDAMAGTSCDPLSCPAPCIPFKYPDDGCWGRAHEMCRLMIGMGLRPRKVWIDCSFGHRLHVATRNNPNCYVEWGWHVAPTLCVRSWFPFAITTMVIDPSLFTTPVTEATWKGVQGDPAATLTPTGPEIFSHAGGTDPNYTQSDSVLATYRLALLNRSNQIGPPPYANCP
ncbi:MAG: hypothetical protein JO079_14460 [Frankiaceae bacterium]|nr:hypothetical protein [Frankiaceae bacterium]MBV9369007.1 hypothetical protein [Frankiales bacterium]